LARLTDPSDPCSAYFGNVSSVSYEIHDMRPITLGVGLVVLVVVSCCKLPGGVSGKGVCWLAGVSDLAACASVAASAADANAS
jgi:hypothetical protein